METTAAKKTGWVMFQNGGEADFYALFFVGYTDKANDPASIGMFGSGFKLAITSALRLGTKILLFIGRDKVTVQTASREVKGETVEQLVFVCERHDGTTEEFGTNLTLGYGAKDWKSHWGIYREMLANCRDADPRGYEVVYGVDPKGLDGYTRVFVEGTEEILDIYRNADYYFKEERHATFTCDLGRIYPKVAPEGETYFYCKGMYVLSTPDASLYDLDLYNMPINESRDASTATLLTHVLQLLDLSPPDIKTEVIRFAIEKGEDGLSTLESSVYWRQSRRPHAWVQAFRRAYPDYVLCSFSDVEYQSMIRMGRKAVRVTRELYNLLSSNGVLTAQRILREEQKSKREVIQPSGTLAEYFQKAFKKVSSRLPEINRLHISFIRLPPHEKNVSFVTCSRPGGEYQFSEGLLRIGPKAIALSLIDALAQTKSLSGKCDPRYEDELMKMVMECIEEAG
jgi:hypothetical protein